MDVWYRLLGTSPSAEARKAAALAGARPLADAPVPLAGHVLLIPAGTPAPDSATLLALLQAHRQRRAAVTLALPDGEAAVGLEGGPAVPETALAVADLARIGPDGVALLEDPTRLADWVRSLGKPVTLWRRGGHAEPPAPSSDRESCLARLAAAGVTIVDPVTTWVDPHAEIASEATILPFTMIEGTCVVGPGCRIGPGSHIRDSRLGQRVQVWFSVVEEARLGDGVQIGPYAHLRPGCELGDGVRVGNFVELKNAKVGAHARLPHHTYMGEVDIGAAANIGAGAVVVNYDGRKKRRARIGDGAMVGCNANVIAPAEVGENGYVAAGSTITDDVPSGALALGRGIQKNFDGWVERKLGPGNASGIRAPEPQ